MIRRTRKPRMKRRVIYLDAAAETALQTQMRAHRIGNASALIRARLTGYRPGSEPGTTAAKADAWWDTRSPQRRVSIFRNHSTLRDEQDQHAHQDALPFEGGPDA